MTNLPRGTDVISRAASHHTEQGRVGAVQRLEEGGRRKREGGKPIPAKVVIRQLLKKLGRAKPQRQTDRMREGGRQTLRDTHVVAPVEHWKMDLVAVALSHHSPTPAPPSPAVPHTANGTGLTGRERRRAAER